MNEITVSILKDNPAALCIYKGNTAKVFTFSDERACAEAAEMCEEIAKNNGYVDRGTVGNNPVVFVIEYGTGDRNAVIFTFSEERDAANAYELAECYSEYANEDENDSDEE